jgi:RNA polymerase sigma factor (sigma-70 family)
MPKMRRKSGSGGEELGKALVEQEPMVHAIARSITSSRADADEVTQDAFLKAVEKLDEVQPRNLQAWLATVTRNRSIDVVRHRKRSRERPASTIIHDDPAARNHFGMQKTGVREDRPLEEPEYNLDLDREVHPRGVEPGEVLLEREELAALREEVGRLPDKERQVVELLFAGEKPADIADTLGIQRINVDQLYFKARGRLKARLLKRLGE